MSDDFCKDDQARQELLFHTQGTDSAFYGLDYVEVESLDDEAILRAYFIGRAPELDEEATFVVRGGRRIQNIAVRHFQFIERPQGEDSYYRVILDRVGDTSPYDLHILTLGKFGQILDVPPANIDPRYASAPFRFVIDEAVDIDCYDETLPPIEKRVEPHLNYLAKDYESLRKLLLDRMSLVMPDWSERHVPDIGIALVEVMAYVGDYLSYFQDAVATEAYLKTARQRISMRRHARLVDYYIFEGSNARTWLHIETIADMTLALNQVFFISGKKQPLANEIMLAEADLRNLPANSYQVFEPLLPGNEDEIELWQNHNEIYLYTWGEMECCLPKGTTSATLIDTKPSQAVDENDETHEEIASVEAVEAENENTSRRILNLQIGDFLVFEEVISPTTGTEADADRQRRHAVRVTGVYELTDPVTDIPLLEVEWHEDDALPFSLCINAIGPAPACEFLENVSVARGNILLVDHGQTLPWEVIGTVDSETQEPVCLPPPCEDDDTPVAIQEGEAQPVYPSTGTPALFRPRLREPNLTFALPLHVNASATALTNSASTETLPEIVLFAIPSLPEFGIPLFSAQEISNPVGIANALRRRSSSDAGAQSAYRLAVIYQNLSLMARAALEAWQDGALEEAYVARVIGQELEDMLERWEPRYDLLNSRPDDRHFVVEMDNDRVAHLRFGDGQLGKQPAVGTTFLAQYRIGTGKLGNVGANTIKRLVMRHGFVIGSSLKPSNLIAATGGRPPETLTEIRLRAPYQYRAKRERAVTADDYARLAAQHPEVERAAARLCWNGSWYEVLVAIDPYGTTEADEALLAEVQQQLNSLRRIGHSFRVEPAEYTGLNITLKVWLKPYYDPSSVRVALRQIFGTGVLRDGTLGFFHPDKLSFGTDIYLSQIVTVAQGVEGVAYVQVTQLEKVNHPSTEALTSGVLLMGATEIARCDNIPEYPEFGRLSLVLLTEETYG